MLTVLYIVLGLVALEFLYRLEKKHSAYWKKKNDWEERRHQRWMRMHKYKSDKGLKEIYDN